MKYLLALLLLASSQAWATKYVRSDCTNQGDGTAYACASSGGGVGAWKNFTPSAVQSSPVTGETLKTCGSFNATHADTGSVMLSGNFANDLIKVSGNCLAEGGAARATWDGNGVLTRLFDSSSSGEANITLSDIDFKGFTQYGVIGQNTTSDNWTIDNATFDCSSGADQCVRIAAGNTGWVIEDSAFYNCYDDCIYTGAPFTARRLIGREWSVGTVAGDFMQSTATDCDGFVFEDLDVESSKDIKQALLANSCPGAVNVTITRGRFVKLGQSINASAGFVPLFFDGPSGTVTVKGAYVTGGRINLFVSGGVSLVADGNIFGPSSASNVHCGSSTTSCTVRNNTINGAGSKGIEMQSATTGIAVNNAIVARVGINRASSGQEHHNIIIATEASCFVSGAAGACDVTDDTDNTTMDWVGGSSPVDAEGFCPHPSSPLRGAGVYYGAWLEGYRSRDLGNPPTIGAINTCAGRAPVGTRQ